MTRQDAVVAVGVGVLLAFVWMPTRPLPARPVDSGDYWDRSLESTLHLSMVLLLSLPWFGSINRAWSIGSGIAFFTTGAAIAVRWAYRRRGGVRAAHSYLAIRPVRHWPRTPVNVLVPGKETVVRRPGADWSFQLPRLHRIAVDSERRRVTLAAPHDSSTFELAGIEETADEVIVELGRLEGHASRGAISRPGYRLPELDEEFTRLRERWKAARLPEQGFSNWASGPAWESNLPELRARLRHPRRWWQIRPMSDRERSRLA